MNLTVLGGSAAGGNTGMGCSGYLIESGETRIVIDLGPGTMLELRKHVDFRELTAIVISHWHVDHYLDIAAFRFAAAYNPLSATRRIPLYMPPGGAELLSAFGQTLPQDERNPHFFDDVFDIAEFEPASPLTIGELQLRFVPTIHFIPCWGMRIQGKAGASIGYTADTGPLPALESFFSGVDLLVAEATDIERVATAGVIGHLTSAEAGALATACGAGALLATHMWEERGFDHYRAGAESRFGGPVHLARPGLKLAIPETSRS